ncbi:peptidoglycan editing factor PgeF [Pseudaestuariivita sp.]|uniref:peptidoglycan editing factor PgeF n=1 Tax=Pseudaestuariivita sp. TaxID=2211669 RepID=UPI004059BBF4
MTSLSPITSDLLNGTKHGFFTREGGVSTGIFASLNCGLGSGDDREALKENRARVATWMGVEAHALQSVHQIHSARVHAITHPTYARPEGDAMVTATPGIALGILTADCQPVLFADEEAGVVGAAHAGWKGALGGVLEATVEAMVGLGATREAIKAVIGPSIGQASYEVGPEFMEQFLDEDPETARYFAQGQGDRLLFDLPGFGLSRLRAAGIAEAEWTRHDTYADPERFFSYRRSVHRKEGDYGRLMACIRV